MPRQPDTRRLQPGRDTLLLALLSCSLAIAAAVAHQPAARTCLVGARLLDVRLGRYADAAGMLIDGDRIAAIYRTPAELPEGIERIDLRGATLVPGLSDLHATAAPTPDADADFFYAMALAHGVTTLRVVDAPTAWAIGQRSRARRGEILAPRLWVAAMPLAPADVGGAALLRVSDAAATRREVTEQARLGVDFVRAHAQAGQEVIRSMVAAAAAAHVRTSAEPGYVTAIDLSRLGPTLLDRLAHLRGIAAEPVAAQLPARDEEATSDLAWEGIGEADIKAFSAGMARSRTGLVPLLAANRSALSAGALARDPAVALLPTRWRDELKARAYQPQSADERRAEAAAAVRSRVVAALWKAGVRIATGVDVASSGYNIPGAGVHRELALLVAAGLTPADAIRAATVSSAELLGASASVGQLKVGSKADLFAVDGDPVQRIEDLSRIRLVVRGGEVLDRDELLRQAARARR